MSARAPFIPRPASRMDANGGDKAQCPASPPATAYEPFRANGLLSADAQAHISGEHTSKPLDMPPHPPSAKFKPLNLSGLGKLKNGSQARQAHLQTPFDSSASHPRSPKSLERTRTRCSTAPFDAVNTRAIGRMVVALVRVVDTKMTLPPESR